jgi:hypothetical protein
MNPWSRPVFADKLADKWLARDYDPAMCSRDWTSLHQTVSLQ